MSAYYVGVLEELDETIAQLEKIYPKFFSGAVDFYLKMIPKRVTSTHEMYVEPNNVTRSYLAAFLAEEIVLYDRVMQHFQFMKSVC